LEIDLLFVTVTTKAFGTFSFNSRSASFKNFLDPQQIAMMEVVDLTTLTPNRCTPRSALLPLIS
jgi:hypothetical protein